MNWKGEVLTFLLLWGLPGAALLAMGLLLARRGPHRIQEALASHRWLVFAATRPVFLLALYLVLGFKAGSDFYYWLDMAKGPILGAPDSLAEYYGPLFGPSLVLGYRLFPLGSGCGMLLVFLLGDAVGLAALPALARGLRGVAAERWACTWYLLSPMLWYQGIVWAQDEPLFVGTLLLGTMLLLRGRPVLGGAALALGACLTKMTFAPYAMTAIVLASADVASLAAAAGAGLGLTGILYGLRWWSGGSTMSLVQTADRQSIMVGAGHSLSDVLIRHGAPLSSLPCIGASLLAILATLGLVAIRMRHAPAAWRTVVGLAGTHLSFVLLVPACASPYDVQGWIFLPLALYGAGAPGKVSLGLLAALLLEFLDGVTWFGIPGDRWNLSSLGITAIHLGAWLWLMGNLLRGTPGAIAFRNSPVAAEAPAGTGAA